MGIRSRTEGAAQTLTDQLAIKAQRDFIADVMEWEEVDYETAWAICLGQTDPVEYEYTLGFKLANPVLQLALFHQRSKIRRKQAADNFARELSDPERELFYSEVFDEKNAKAFKDALKKKKKKVKG